jgi:hypothetical protein
MSDLDLSDSDSFGMTQEGSYFHFTEEEDEKVPVTLFTFDDDGLAMLDQLAQARAPATPGDKPKNKGKSNQKIESHLTPEERTQIEARMDAIVAKTPLAKVPPGMDKTCKQISMLIAKFNCL